VTVASAAAFNTLLAGGGWDLVAVDVPSTIPAGGWGPTQSWVDNGGRAVMSYWDWDAFPSLANAFDVSVSSSFSLVGRTLFDSGTSGVFSGVTMPNSDWHNHWGDDGDEFNLIGSSLGLGHIGNPSTPVMALGNDGRTIASFVIDEAGDTWLGDGSGVQLWENMMNMALPAPGALALLGVAGLAGPRRRRG
jgi:hypothetical protein